MSALAQRGRDVESAAQQATGRAVGYGAPAVPSRRPIFTSQQVPSVPQSNNSRIRAKDTSRAEARRRHREQHRSSEAVVEAVAPAAETSAPARSGFQMPDVRADIKALPQVFRNPWVWLPFLMLVISFVLAILLVEDVLPEGVAYDVASLYVGLTLPPTALFVFFIGGFLATRASYLVGGILGAFDALLLTILNVLMPAVADDPDLTRAGLTAGQAQGTAFGLSAMAQLWGIAILVGVLAAAFAAWYRRFLRQSQERAKVNRAAREQEQARKAKEQARVDKQSARDVKRTTK
jgi:hypothetical protein